MSSATMPSPGPYRDGEAGGGEARSRLRPRAVRGVDSSAETAETADELLRLIESGRLRRAARLSDLVDRASQRGARSGADRVIAMPAPMRELLPGRGLRRGSTVAVRGATSLLFALLAGATNAGSWCAVVGMPALGAVAAAELGVDLDRVALVPDPGPDWPEVVAALLDGCDLVIAATPAAIAPVVARRLSARARHRSTVLVPVGDWPGAELTLDATGGTWYGLGQGRGRLRYRTLTIVAQGRGAAGRARQVRMWLPALTGPLPPTAGHTTDETSLPPAGRLGDGGGRQCLTRPQGLYPIVDRHCHADQ